MKIEELEKELNQGNLKEIYLLYGEETYLIESCLKKIKKLFGEKVPGINYIELDEESISNSLMTEIQTPPFGYEKKLIIVKNSGIFKKETKRKVAGLKEIRDELEKYLKNNFNDIKDTLILVFVEEGVDKLNITKQIEEVRWTNLRSRISKAYTN